VSVFVEMRSASSCKIARSACFSVSGGAPWSVVAPIAVEVDDREHILRTKSHVSMKKKSTHPGFLKNSFLCPAKLIAMLLAHTHGYSASLAL